MNCNTCKMCESADKRLESFVASKAGEFETAFQRTIDQKVNVDLDFKVSVVDYVQMDHVE